MFGSNPAMLSPNVVETSEDIAGSYNQFLAVKSFANSSSEILVGPLSPDPDWLAPLRTRIGSLAGLGAKWRDDSPDILVGYYLPFVNYATTFGAFADQAPKFGNNKSYWSDALTALIGQIETCRGNASTSQTAFTNHLAEIKIVEGQIDQSLATAWTELAKDENLIVELATEVTRLQDRLAVLEDSLTSSVISTGKTYFQTAATITYQVLVAASTAVPYLTILTEIYTVGKMAYDLIVTDQEINAALDQIAKLTVDADQAAQAAAMSKAVIVLINNLDVRVTGLNDHLPAIDRTWASERDKLAGALDAIDSGAAPSDVFALASMDSAKASWNTLADLANKVITTSATPGKPVFINTSRTGDRISSTPV